MAYKLGITANDKASPVLAKFGRNVKQTSGALDVMKGVLGAQGVTSALNLMSSAVGSAIDSIQEIIDTGDKWDKLSQKVGVTSEFLSAMDHAANLSGTSIETVGNAIRKMSKLANDSQNGLTTAERAFSQLNLSATDSNGTLRNSQELFLEAADRISDLTNETEKVAYAQELFGKSGAELIPLLSQGSDAIKEQMLLAEELGVVYTDDMAKSAAEAKDAQENFNRAIDGAKKTVLIEYLPAITEGFGQLTNFIIDNKDAIQILGGVIESVANGSISALKYAFADTASVGEILENDMESFAEFLSSKLGKDLKSARAEVASLQEAYYIAGKDVNNLNDSFENQVEEYKKLSYAYGQWSKEQERERDAYKQLTEISKQTNSFLSEEQKKRLNDDGLTYTAQLNLYKGFLADYEDEQKKAINEASAAQRIADAEMLAEQKKTTIEKERLKKEENARLEEISAINFENKLIKMDDQFAIEEERAKAERDALITKLGEDKAITEQYNLQMMDIAKRRHDYEKSLRDKETAQRQQAALNYIGALGDVLSATKASAVAQKRIAQAQAVVQGYVAIQNALAISPFFLGASLAVGAAAKAFANVAAIENQKFHTGGMIPGSYGQEVPITAMAGEAVIDAGTTAQAGGYQGIMSAIENSVNGKSSGVTINISGGIVDRDFVQDKLIPEINSYAGRSM